MNYDATRWTRLMKEEPRKSPSGVAALSEVSAKPSLEEETSCEFPNLALAGTAQELPLLEEIGLLAGTAYAGLATPSGKR